MPGPMKDLSGRRFGKLLVIGPAPRLGKSLAWFCRCDCGAETSVSRSCLTSGKTRTCGCSRSKPKSHGHSGRGRVSPEYRAWKSMMNRCTNTKAIDWRSYGGRGIAVCDRWRSFESFLADMGPRPHGCSIDRIDNNGNYEPGNCRWSTPMEQGQNRRTSRLVTHNGVTLTATEWSRRLGGDLQIVHNRLDAGWSVEDAVTRPPRR